MVRKHPKLKREIGLWQVVLAGIGIILGAGIYVLIGRAAALSGNAVWISFLISALVAMLTGLSYAELSSIFPRAGAEYVYTKRAFGYRLSLVVGWLLVLSGFVFASTVSLGFAGYFLKLFGSPIIPTAAVLIVLLSFLLYYGVKESIWFAVVFTLIEVSGLIIIIAMAAPYLGSVNYLSFPSISGVFQAAALIFFAYIGFEQITRLSEETKNPDRNIPRALILSIIITTVLYIFVAISAVSILDWQTLGQSEAPLADVAARAFGPNAFTIMAVIALFATANTVLLMMLATSRILYGIGRSFSGKNIFARLHSKRNTPWIATLVVMFFSILFLGFGDIGIVANITDFLIFFTFIIINLSVIRIRYMGFDKEREFRIPLNIGRFPVIPVLGILSCLILMIYMDAVIMLYSAILIVLGFLFFEILNRKGIRARFE
ncbi:MAG: amino acid permease [Candidatus Aenigmarchaeota archaeon]|nr:amino acid permease [Candidatus Aenigmarchaeota archaeon]